jgi:hypothetical protein
MASGKVGSGDQNRWKPTGEIFEDPPQGGTPFQKRNAGTSARRKDSACWTAGTPVTWQGNPSNARVTTKRVAGIDMLVTKDSSGKAIEYHPVITFFNDVMSQIMKDDHLDWLEGLDDEDKGEANAKALWEYLVGKYPVQPEVPEPLEPIEEHT